VDVQKPLFGRWQRSNRSNRDPQQAEARGFVIVPLSAVAKQRLGASG
jgi:hypothetical protein